jgi:DNA-3-methyladenine glycosylase I
MKKSRCSWSGIDPVYNNYHDELWGVPVYDSKDLFAKLILDGAQAGLSWITILKRWDGYYKAFDGLDPDKMAKYQEAKIKELMADEGIVRNKLKIRAAVTNAQAYLKIEEELGSFSEYLWSFVDGKVITNSLKDISESPATSPESDAMSKDLKKKGFKFVGSTLLRIYASCRNG